MWPRRRTLYSSCQVLAAPLFQDIFKMAGLAPASEDVRSFTVLCSRTCFGYVLFTATELSSCIASFETTGNLVTSTFLKCLWTCYCVVFVCLCFARYHTNVEQMLKKNRQTIRQNENWQLETYFKVGFQPEGAVIN